MKFTRMQVIDANFYKEYSMGSAQAAQVQSAFPASSRPFDIRT